MYAGAEKAAGRGGEDSNGGATAEATGKIRFNVLPAKNEICRVMSHKANFLHISNHDLNS